MKNSVLTLTSTSAAMHFLMILMPALSVVSALPSRVSEPRNLGFFMRVRPATPSITPASSSSSPTLLPSPSAGPVFSEWSSWSNCSRKCTQKRKRSCLTPASCGANVMIERRACPRKTSADGSIKACQPRREARHQTFLKRLLSDIYDPAEEEDSALTMEEFLYSDWTVWSRCSRSCRQKRFKECQFPLLCGRKMILEERGCFPEGTRCSEMKRNNATYGRTKIVFKGDAEAETAITDDEVDDDESHEEIDAFEAPKEVPRNEGRRERKRERKTKNETAASFGDFECGMRPTFNPRRLRIIGGTLSRRGAWPWQVSVMNR